MQVNYNKQPVKTIPIPMDGAPIKHGSLPLGTEKFEYSGKIIKPESISTMVSNTKGLYVSPLISFSRCYEYYLTVGKVQNAVEKLISDIITRDWYYESDNEDLIKQMESWEEDYDFSHILEGMMRDWLTCGNSIISFDDWIPVQMTSIIGMVRDKFGETKEFMQEVGFNYVPLQAENFLHTKFIDADRQAWGWSLYQSLMTVYTDMDGKQSLSLLDVYRQMEQDISRTHHKYASPRTIYAFEKINKDVLDNQITPLLESMKSGDRLTLNAKPELIMETIDPKARFTESIQQINDEIEAGLQSSANRLITDPSAMADAREAGEQDDDRVLGIMEKIRRIMNEIIIPKVTGTVRGDCEFKWGSKDSFELEFPPGLATALSMGLVTQNEGRKILISTGWKLDNDDLPVITNEKKKNNSGKKERKVT